MYNLSNYVDALLELLAQEKNKEKRHLIIESWSKVLKNHSRDLEGKKILDILENRIEKLEEKASVSISDEKERKALAKYFEKKNLSAEWKIEPELLGGVRIVWDNKLIDNTLSSQLNKLKQTFNGE